MVETIGPVQSQQPFLSQASGGLGLAVMTGRLGGRGILLSRKVNPTKMILCTQLNVFSRAVSTAWIVSVHNPCLEDRD